MEIAIDHKPKYCMKKLPALIQMRNGISFLMVLVFVCMNALAQTQPAPVIHATVTTQKVQPANTEEYEKVMKEYWKPLHQLRKQNGKITNWTLYKVHFAGASEEYNYVSVTYYESFIKTEPNDNFPELMKAANPKADAAAVLARTRDLRTIQRQAVYNRIDGTTPKSGAQAAKYVVIDFMQTKGGLDAAYYKLEREIWKPMHQTFVDSEKLNSWTFWGLALPGGSGSNHDYAISNAYSGYSQIVNQDYVAAFKKAHPEKDLQAIADQTSKARDIVRREIWELIATLN
jgi:hypothetical protein